MVVRVPMRDGVRLATHVYRPKGATGPLPTILIKTPYNEMPYKAASTRNALDAIKHGYALVLQNERGRYYSEGEWEILGHPQTDGYDTLTWIAKQSWSNGKVGTRGCSSTASKQRGRQRWRWRERRERTGPACRSRQRKRHRWKA